MLLVRTTNGLILGGYRRVMDAIECAERWMGMFDRSPLVGDVRVLVKAVRSGL